MRSVVWTMMRLLWVGCGTSLNVNSRKAIGEPEKHREKNRREICQERALDDLNVYLTSLRVSIALARRM